MMNVYLELLIFDLAFVVWNTIVSLGEQKQYYMGSDSNDGSDAFNMGYMVQGDDLLEVNFKYELEEDIDMPYDELASFCQKVLEKENIFLSSKLNDICE